MSRVFWLGVFIVGTLLILAAGVFLIGGKEFLFSRTFSVTAAFQNVAGLTEGAEVRVGGIREGTVKRIDLPSGPEQKVKVLMQMHELARNLIRKDSVAAIKTEGLLGDQYIEISFGSVAAPQLQGSDSIRSENPIDVTDLTTEVAAQTRAALGAVQDDMEALKKNFLLRGFFNKRGYDDSDQLTKHAIARVPSAAPDKEFDYSDAELFEGADGAKLKSGRLLKEAGTFLEQQKFKLVVIAASEVLGDSQLDRVQTEAKAVVVRDYLVQNFRVDDTRIRTIGLGKSSASGASSRIQILVYP
jgi:hypothetical protein